jgi:heterodisulfide reductase subunit A2
MKKDRVPWESAQDKKVGVYICHCGGNISDHVDVAALCERTGKTPGVSVARTNMFMCSDPGQEMIIKDLQEGKVDRVVVASCAPSLHEVTFRSTLQRAGFNPYLYEHANIREQVSWVHHGRAATEKATVLVAAAVAKAGRLEPLEPIRMEAVRHVTVIGAGIAGLQAAKDLACRGIPVTIVEKTSFLGGNVAKLDTLSPVNEKASELLTRLAGEVLEHPDITIYNCAQVIGFEGYVGNFGLKVSVNPVNGQGDDGLLSSLQLGAKRRGDFVPSSGIVGGPFLQERTEISIETGAVIFATGFKPYQPGFGEYGFGRHAQVVTLPQAIQALAGSEGPGRVWHWQNRPIRNLALIHCVGSRQIPGVHEAAEGASLNEYCSRTCCSASLGFANQIREKYPATRVFEFYRDIRTYGRGQEELYRLAAKNRVLFFRFEAEEPPRVAANDTDSDSPLLVTVKDTLTFGEEIQVPADLVVLAVGMEPSGVQDLVAMMKLPVGGDGFLLEVHPKLRPVELPNAGLLLAGTCQAPMDIGEATNAASAAAVKASGLLDKGFVELDPFVAEVDQDRCKGTGACVEACLGEDALRLVDIEVDGQLVRKAQVAPAFCLGCGACAAVCPENAINIKGWTLEQYESMVDAIVSDLAA